MIRFKTEQVIERPSQDVWAYAADIARHPEWMGVMDARTLRGAGTEVGARARERVKVGPRTVEVDFEVSESIPAQRIAWKVAGGGPIAGDITLDLQPLGASQTRAKWSGWIGLKGAWRLLEPIMAAEVRTGEAAELRRLKANLEKSTAAAAASS